MTLDNLVVRYCDAIVREQEKWNKNKVSCETTENGIELDVDQYSIDEGRQLICMIKRFFNSNRVLIRLLCVVIKSCPLCVSDTR